MLHTEIKLNREIAMQGRRVILQQKRMKCGVGMPVTLLSIMTFT